MTPTQKLREAEKLATKGPWVAGTSADQITTLLAVSTSPLKPKLPPSVLVLLTGRDMHFIALTRNSLPSLLDYVEDMAAEIKYNRGESPPQNPLEQATDLARRRFEAAVKGAE